MLSFSYTIDLQQREILHDVDRLRTLILSYPMSLKAETKLQWEALAIRTWATISHAGYDVPKQYVAAILSHPTRPTHSVTLIQSVRSVFDFIHTTWRANPKPVSVSAIETMYSILYPNLHDFSSQEASFKELLDYLAAKEEHPVIQAAIAHIHILSMPTITDAGLLARMTHYLLLAKYGYDIRGFIAPEFQWYRDPSYMRLSALTPASVSLTNWLSYMGDSMRTTMEALYRDMQESRFHVDFPTAFWELSDRQKELLKSLQNPVEKITNRQYQRRFRVSQITASRDLTKLTALGLLYPHGKGRAVYYTKI